MPEAIQMTAWSSVLLGLYALFAGIGALRNPDTWRTMIEEVAKSPALQLVAGLLELIVGAAIYLANPWVPNDILACILKAVGGLMMIEALVVVAFCDIYSAFWLKNLTHMHRGWAWFTMVMGLALTVAGSLRFH